jgi:hypothetical protein
LRADVGRTAWLWHRARNRSPAVGHPKPFFLGPDVRPLECRRIAARRTRSTQLLDSAKESHPSRRPSALEGSSIPAARADGADEPRRTLHVRAPITDCACAQAPLRWRSRNVGDQGRNNAAVSAPSAFRARCSGPPTQESIPVPPVSRVTQSAAMPLCKVLRLAGLHNRVIPDRSFRRRPSLRSRLDRTRL